MKSKSKLSQKPQVVLKFEWENLRAFVCKEKNYVFPEVLSPQKVLGSENHQSAIRKQWSANI